MGCRTEPAAVHIAHVLQRLHFFQFFNFFMIWTTYCKKKFYTYLPQKKFDFFFIIHKTYRKKNYTNRRFFCTQLTFFTVLGAGGGGLMVLPTLFETP